MRNKQTFVFILFALALAAACRNLIESGATAESTAAGASSLCDPASEAFKIRGSLVLPQAQDIPGQIPGDTAQNARVLIAFLQNRADTFSWQSFIALNWLANEDGTPDSTTCFGSRDGLTVWEHWMPSHQVLVPPGQSPARWETGLKPEGTPYNAGELADLRLIGKPGDLEGIHELEDLEADEHPLIDQHGNFTLYEVFYNRPTYDYIVDGKLYSRAGQAEFARNWPDLTHGLTVTQNGKKLNIAREYQRAYFSVGNAIDSTEQEGPVTLQFTIGEGAVIVKSAWRRLTPQDDPTAFHVRTVRGDDGAPVALGLVGMHIIHKVAEATQWIWSTFEHVRNAPLAGPDGKPILEPGVDYLYFEEAAAADTSRFNKPPQKPIPADPAQRTPTQVVRLRDVEASTQKINQAFHEQIRQADPNSVWLNYRLTGTQWPFDPTLFTRGSLYQPPVLANAVMETYMQVSSSCMDCHADARFLQDSVNFGYDADFVYQLGNAR